mmetsp:Transcript_110675/g.308378  ORF Transcript_110675/g.308378 Transcript_110675/m.308378 type:complete len:222 (-) Transcript_110675:214-879(-)|eukprot:CAMPEP_0179164144 /NCGR_PEP_ID=MMETSP0796-20121207/80533_1 /TAXON_ID=73915 /ORGANISM="Pyrodinium bahamense, Strain pbaha01" /LENGTH=221 /DNA_ID=CAMNT_0020866555 /DNA_START=57 /DNA_END=722 /DNA_ORIENTATION=-
MIALCIDKDGHVRDWSSAAEAMSGFTRDEVLGKHFVEELLDIEGQDLMAEQISHAWSGQTVQQIYLPFYTKCGRRKDLCLSARLSWSKAEDIHHVTLIGGLIAGDACKTISVDKNGCITGLGRGRDLQVRAAKDHGHSVNVRPLDELRGQAPADPGQPSLVLGALDGPGGLLAQVFRENSDWKYAHLTAMDTLSSYAPSMALRASSQSLVTQDNFQLYRAS